MFVCVARNWLLTAALETEGVLQLSLGEQQKKHLLQQLSLQQIFDLLPVRLNPEAAADLEALVLFKFAAEPQQKQHKQQQQQQQQQQQNQHQQHPNDDSAEPQQEQEQQQQQQKEQQEQQQQQQQQEQQQRQQQQEEEHCVHFRRGIVYTRAVCERTPDVIVHTSAATWKGIVSRSIRVAAAAAKGDIRVQGNLMLLVQCLAAVELDSD